MLSNPSGVSLAHMCISSFTIEIASWLVDSGPLELGILVKVCPTNIMISFVGNALNNNKNMPVAKPVCDVSQDVSAVSTRGKRKALVILLSGAMERARNFSHHLSLL